MARMQGVAENKAGFITRLAYWYARRVFGKVPEPLTVVAHHPWLSRGYAAMELAFRRSRRVDEKLKALASIKTATLVGCPF
jgi:hypothetical protein